jgi:hypothetical protein
MVNIDTVYQRVLALANKEQRGYITPQEFNLFANQAQMEIFEQYFYDINHFEIRDAIGNINEKTTELTKLKRDIFMRSLGVTTMNALPNPGNTFLLPDFVYRINRVEAGNKECEYMSVNAFKDVITGPPLLRPSMRRPVWTLLNGGRIKVHGGTSQVANTAITSGVGLHYWQLPDTVSWGYFIIGDKALYDSNTAKTTHFQLHASEETELIYKILRLAGVSTKREDSIKSGQGMDILQQQNEKQ